MRKGNQEIDWRTTMGIGRNVAKILENVHRGESEKQEERLGTT